MVLDVQRNVSAKMEEIAAILMEVVLVPAVGRYEAECIIAIISYFPTENRKSSIDCLERQRKVAGNFTS